MIPNVVQMDQMMALLLRGGIQYVRPLMEECQQVRLLVVSSSKFALKMLLERIFLMQ